MKQDLHPEYTEVSAKCSCDIVLTINSVLKERVSVGICSRRDPFSTRTGKQNTIGADGRVERIRIRFGSKAKTMEVGGS